MMPRPLAFSVYIAAAVAQLWPILLLAMSTAFAGLDEKSLSVESMFIALNLCLTLLAAAGASILAEQFRSQALLVAGPTLSLILAADLLLAVLRGSPNRLWLIAPQSLTAIGALFVGWENLRSQKLKGAS